MRELEKLRTLVRRGSAYLTERLEAKAGEPDANPLYDALGGVRKKEELGGARLKALRDNTASACLRSALRRGENGSSWTWDIGFPFRTERFTVR